MYRVKDFARNKNKHKINKHEKELELKNKIHVLLM